MISYAAPPDHEPGNEARQLRIADEFRRGFALLETLGKAVTYFGAHALSENDPWYEEARKLARLMAAEGFATVTGGGPGIMEAANRGAIEAGGRSIGFNLIIKQEERNLYVQEAVTFYYLFVRRVLLASAGHAYVFFPGGFGTLDEFYEISTLIHIHKLHQDVPVVLVGEEFWNPMFKWLKETAVDKFHFFEGVDLTMWTVVKDAEAAHAFLKQSILPTRLYY
jgi:uncharacterized protein (TIGR00730 family)